MIKSYDESLKELIEQAKTKRVVIETKGKRKTEPNLLIISNALDDYYFYNKLKVYCAYLSYSILVNADKLAYEEVDFSYMESIITIIQEKMMDNPILKTFIKIVELFKNINKPEKEISSIFQETLELQMINKDVLSMEESLEIYSLLSNICIYRLNNNHSQYKNSLIKVNTYMIDIIYQMGKSIQATLFENIVLTAIKLKDKRIYNHIKIEQLKPDNPIFGFKDNYEWVEKFMSLYKAGLDEDGKRYHYPYCQAILHFYKKDFHLAHKILYKFQPRGMFIGMNAKMLYLQTIYEIYESQTFFDDKKHYITEKEMRQGMDAYRALIRYEKTNKQFLSYQLDYYATFDKLFRKLFPLHQNFYGVYKKGNNTYQKNKATLITEINQYDFSYNKWFLEKVKNI